MQRVAERGTEPATASLSPGSGVGRLAVIAMLAFLTLVDLFAMQAVLPSLIARYRVSPAAMGLAVNASTIGMAIASLATSFLGRHVPRREGVAFSLMLLSLPTSALAFAPDLGIFAVLRGMQGLCMACAFTLMLAHLGERYDARASAGAFAAYIAGNVASNLFGRLLSAGVSDHYGLTVTFYLFAGLNLAGAALAFAAIGIAPRGETASPSSRSALEVLALHWRNPALRASFGIGFLILFAFIGTFTYVNFVLTSDVIGLSTMQLGFVYFVFIPSIILTPMAGQVARRIGARRAVIGALAIATLGLPGLLLPDLPPVLAGLTLVAAGTFFAQATATGYVSRTSGSARGQAGGIYLASYYGGGLAGSVVLGQVFDHAGWSATIAALALALVAGCGLAFFLAEPKGR